MEAKTLQNWKPRLTYLPPQNERGQNESGGKHQHMQAIFALVAKSRTLVLSRNLDQEPSPRPLNLTTCLHATATDTQRERPCYNSEPRTTMFGILFRSP